MKKRPINFKRKTAVNTVSIIKFAATKPCRYWSLATLNVQEYLKFKTLYGRESVCMRVGRGFLLHHPVNLSGAWVRVLVCN